MPATQLFINGRFLSKKITGTERFAVEILRAMDALLAQQPNAPRVTILAPTGTPAPPWLNHIGFTHCGKLHGHLWEQWDLARAARGGLLLNFTNSGPALHYPSIIVIHDALVFRWPSNYTFAYRTFHRLLDHLLARRATIITVSDFSRHELASVLGVNAETIPVIPNGHEHILACTPDYGILDRLGLRDTSFFMMVGSPSPTKNVARAIEGFTQLAHPDAKLVIVGSAKNTIFQGVASAGASNVIMPGRLSDEEIAALYTHAKALVFPSLYEGFGIPPLEAMTLGCPVIASGIPPVKEVCGDAALYFDPLKPAEIAQAMQKLLDNSALRDELIRKGKIRSALFSWRTSAQKLLKKIDSHLRQET